MRQICKFTFRPEVPVAEVESSLLLAVVGIESLHGDTRVRLELQHVLDPESGTCVIDATTEVGRDLTRLFTGYLQREFGAEAFVVLQIDGTANPADHSAAA